MPASVPTPLGYPLHHTRHMPATGPVLTGDEHPEWYKQNDDRYPPIVGPTICFVTAAATVFALGWLVGLIP